MSGEYMAGDTYQRHHSYLLEDFMARQGPTDALCFFGGGRRSCPSCQDMAYSANPPQLRTSAASHWTEHHDAVKLSTFNLMNLCLSMCNDITTTPNGHRLSSDLTQS